MAASVSDRLFRWIADLGVRRPVLVAIVLLVVLAGGGLLGAQLTVSTSRTGLVSDDNPEQAKLRRFFERFGRPDAPTVLVSGGTAEQQRALVDRLQAAFEREPNLAGRVLGRLRPKDVAEVLLLQQPNALVQLRAAVPPGQDLARLVESGAVGWIAAIADRLESSLDGEDAEPAKGAPAAAAASGLDALATLAVALDDHLAGSSPLDRFADSTNALAKGGIDERGYLVTGEGKSHIIALYPELVSDEGSELRPMVERIRAIRDEVLVDSPGLTADVTGLPAIIVDELAVVQQGLQDSTIWATLGILLLCWLLFRSIYQTIVANLPLLPGVVVTLGAVQLLYGHLNLITSSFVAVLLGLGIDFAVHVVSRFNEAVRAGADRAEAVRQALARTGPGIFSGAVITAVGFLAGITTEFTAYGELGVITAVGLLVVMLSTFAVLPLLLARGRGKGPPKVSDEPPGLALLPGLVRRNRKLLAIGGIAAGLAGIFGLSRIEFDPRYFGFLPEKAESGRALLELEYDPIASPVFANMSADSIEAAREMAAELRGLDTVAGVQTPSDLVPPIGAAEIESLRQGFAGITVDPDFEQLAAHQVDATRVAKEVGRVVDALDEVHFAMTQAGMSAEPAERAKAAFVALKRRLGELDAAGQARLAALDADAATILAPAWRTARKVAERGSVAPSDLPPLFARRFAAKDDSGVALYVVPAGKFWDESVAEAFAVDVRRIDPEVSGLALDHVAHGKMIVNGFRRAAAIAAVGILIILLIDFRNVRDALLALLPTVLGWGWMLGFMVVFGVRFDVANIVALPLVLGVGIAYGVHLMHRVREEDAHPGQSAPSQRPRIDDAIRGTGGAIAVAALTTAVGFAALMATDYGGMRSLGIVMVVGITACLVATVLVLPAVLLLLRRAE